MADVGERGDRGRKRRRRLPRKERGSDKGDCTSAPSKPPIILAKPPSEHERHAQLPTLDAPAKLSVERVGEEGHTKPAIIMLKARERGDDRPHSPSIPTILAAEGLGQPTYQIQRNPAVVNQQILGEGGSAKRLTMVPEMMFAQKLVDDSLMWCDGGLEMLLDQTDFLTVGVLGSQGVGKSTILSLLAGNSLTESQKSFVFRPQSREVREVAGHQTAGIDLLVTPDRIIFLDSQAVLSSSVLDHMVHHDKKLANEYSSAENCLEMQSLMLGTFLMTVCNVVVVVVDWFSDLSLLQFIQTCEMLKPCTPTSVHDINSTSDESPEHFPHIVFVINKATSEDFHPDTYGKMRETLNSMFAQSKLKYKSGVNMAASGALPSLYSAPDPQQQQQQQPNLFILPNFHTCSSSRRAPPDVTSLLPSYRGHPSFDSLLRLLRKKILSVPRSLLTHTTLSEKNWFHYSARIWEAIKKSQLLAEYNRLLP